MVLKSVNRFSYPIVGYLKGKSLRIVLSFKEEFSLQDLFMFRAKYEWKQFGDILTRICVT